MANFSYTFISTHRGRRLRTAVFVPEKQRGKTCVLLNGQAEFIEKYLEVIFELNSRGYTVATLDWRGQGGSARALSEPLKGHVGGFGEYDDDLLSFMDKVVGKLTNTPPLIVAHSMGGHIAIRALRGRPGLFGAAVLAAPMVGILTRGYPPAVARGVTALHAALGKTKTFAWGMAERDPLKVDFASQLSTSDEGRFARTQKMLREHPELRLAGPTWGWIAAAYRSMKRVNAPGYVEAIKAPVVVFGAGKDRIVDTLAVRRFAARLPHGRYVEIAGSEHEILMEKDAIRAQFWTAFDAFVAAV